MLLVLLLASLVGAGGASSSSAAKLPCTFKFARPAPSKLVVGISNCTAPDVVGVRFQFEGKTTISHATPFRVKFTTCKILQKNTWDCRFGGGLPPGPTAKPTTATLTLVGYAVGLIPNYLIVYAVYSDGTKLKEVYRLPLAH